MGYDPDLQGVGSTPWRDTSSSLLFIPTFPTLFNKTRYLFRLATVIVPDGGTCRLKGIRQALTIGTLADASGQDAGQIPVERDVVSPFWKFPDGNVSWHVTVQPHPVVSVDRRLDAAQAPSTSPALYGVSDALLYTLDDSGDPYVAPGGGIPPGTPLGSLGTLLDMRYPWYSQATRNDMDVWVEGSSQISLFAAVKQTDPETRQSLAEPIDYADAPLGGLPEDQFLSLVPGAIYRHIGGSLIVEVDRPLSCRQKGN